MTVLTESQVWAAERRAVASRLSVAERVALWFAPRSSAAEPDPFTWHDTAELIRKAEVER